MKRIFVSSLLLAPFSASLCLTYLVIGGMTLTLLSNVIGGVAVVVYFLSGSSADVQDARTRQWQGKIISFGISLVLAGSLGFVLGPQIGEFATIGVRDLLSIGFFLLSASVFWWEGPRQMT
jgi:hypothetical protein